jgi:hypothetical protein
MLLAGGVGMVWIAGAYACRSSNQCAAPAVAKVVNVLPSSSNHLSVTVGEVSGEE